MNDSKVSLKPINELKGMVFEIPDYQRGYKWDIQQALDLLSDVDSFREHISSDDEIYCIQPLVVKGKNEKIMDRVRNCQNINEVHDALKGIWEVVDGQQRLTTIFIILKILGVADHYILSYDTRPGSEDFLNNNIEGKDEAFNNIDYYHMHYVYMCVKQWFENKDQEYKESFLNVLLNRVNFIWYELPIEDNAIETFKRLNIGKIPLTNSELIKALILNDSNFVFNKLDISKNEIAIEWDAIEHFLQDDRFWLFINSETNDETPTRIDFILNNLQLDIFEEMYNSFKNYRPVGSSMKKPEFKTYLDDNIGNDEYKPFRTIYFFYKFSKKDCSEVTKIIWEKITRYYYIFQEWYNDYRTYHYIGFLATIDEYKKKYDVRTFIKKWSGMSKKDFVDNYLKAEIKDAIHREWFSDLDNHTFGDEGQEKTQCRSLLLLHNVETIVRQNNALVKESRYKLPNFERFPFHLFRKEEWQVEHISPNSGNDFSDNFKKTYLLLARRYLDEANLRDEIDQYVRNPNPTQNEFEQIINEIYSALSSNLTGDNVNKIFNYVLLDRRTNQEYSNSIYPIKRYFLMEKEQGWKVVFEKPSQANNYALVKDVNKTIESISFVLPCTKNVFAKTYTISPTNLLEWTIRDANAYLEDIKKKLDFYLR